MSYRKPDALPLFATAYDAQEYPTGVVEWTIEGAGLSCLRLHVCADGRPYLLQQWTGKAWQSVSRHATATGARHAAGRLL